MTTTAIFSKKFTGTNKFTGSKNHKGISTLVKKYEYIVNDMNKMEEQLKSDKTSPNEKLRNAINFLKQLVELDDEIFGSEASMKDFKETFLQITEKYYPIIVEAFREEKKTYRPIIKLIEMCEVMLECFHQGELSLAQEIKKFEAAKEKESYEAKNRLLRILEAQAKDFQIRINCLLTSFFNKKEYFCRDDWRIIRKLLDVRKKFEVKMEKEYLIQNFLYKLQNTKEALIWRKETNSVKKTEKTITSLMDFAAKKKDKFLECLVKGRFDKKDLNTDNTIIIGDDGGLYMLLNSVQPEGDIDEEIMIEKTSKEYIDDKKKKSETSKKWKIILGKGSFGKVRIGLCILRNEFCDIAQLVCVKKSHSLNSKSSKYKKISDLTSSTLDDYFAKMFCESIHAPSIHAPAPLDMAIILNESIGDAHRKGYLIMEIFPGDTAKNVFSKSIYQKWEYQKPYIIEILKGMKELLDERIYNSDLKPENTLFDPLSRTVAIIDLGSSLKVEKENDIRKFDVTIGGFGFTKEYCPPEILADRQQKSVNLYKAMSFLCGMVIQEITQRTDLAKGDRENLKKIVERMMIRDKEVAKRMDLEEVIERVKKIGNNEYHIETYIKRMRDSLDKDPSMANLNSDIMIMREKGMIPQKVVDTNPNVYLNQKTRDLRDELREFLNKKGEDGLLVLLGEAGSGKSIGLQLTFVEEILDWSSGKALPIYFNMADETDLRKFIAKIKKNLRCNLEIEEGYEEIHLFIDSLDEGEDMSEINKQKERLIIDEYLEVLKNCRVKKMLLSCRTDFLINSEGFEDLSIFQANNQSLTPKIRYIARVDYALDSSQMSKDKKFEILVKMWLKKEGIPERRTKRILKSISQLGLQERMKTGLMFSMIMRIVSKEEEESSLLVESERTRKKLSRPDIYRITIRGEIKHKLNRAFRERRKEKEELVLREIWSLERGVDPSKIFGALERLRNESSDAICDGLERLGEKIAVEMTKKDKNRIRFSELEKLLKGSNQEYVAPSNANAANTNSGEKPPEELRFLDERAYISGKDDEMRIKDKILFQMCRILGLKLETRSGIGGTKRKDEKEEVDVGFGHETYKNYYLLRGVKRTLRQQNEELAKDNHNKRVLEAILDNEKTLKNFELLKFLGEEIKRDPGLTFSLRGLLEKEKDPKTRKPRRAAVILSILVAGQYSFSYQNLSGLDLSGANMRGGMFYGAKFQNTALNKANLRYCCVCDAVFVNCDVSGIELGVLPDLLGHESAVNCVIWSPDGKKIASGSSDKAVKIWDHASGLCAQTFIGHSSIIYTVCWCGDGKRVASGSADNTIKIWDLQSAQCAQTLTGHEAAILSVAWSFDERKLASSSNDNSIKVWSMESYTCEFTLISDNDPVSSIAWTSDDKKIASGSRNKTVKIWDLENRKCLKTLLGHSGAVYCVAWCGDFRKLASGSSDSFVKIWDAVSGNCLQTLRGHRGAVFSICWGIDARRIASGSADESIKIWDSISGECAQSFLGHASGISSVSWSSDGKKIVSGSDDKAVKLWDSAAGDSAQNLEGHTEPVNCIIWNQDDERIATASDDGTVNIFDSSNGDCVQTLRAYEGPIMSVSWTQDGKRIASCGTGKTVSIWDTLNGENTLILEGHEGAVNCVSWNADNKTLLSGSADNNIKVWDTQAGECTCTLSGHFSAINAACWSPEGTLVASGSLDKTIKIWNPDIRKCLKSLSGHAQGVTCIFWNAEPSTLISGSLDKTIKIWNALNGDCLKTLAGHLGTINALSWDINSKRIASGSSDGTIRIWDTSTEKSLQIIRGYSNKVLSVAWSNDGGRLASSSLDRSVNIWAGSDTVLKTFPSKSRDTSRGIEDWKKIIGDKELASPGLPVRKFTDFKQSLLLKNRIINLEERFNCSGSSFTYCNFDPNDEKDLGLKIVITQGRGRWTGPLYCY